MHVAGARPQPRLPATPPRCGQRDDDPDGFQWIDANDAGRNVFSFVRRGAPATPGPGRASPTSPRSRTRATGSACPSAGAWDEVLNTDAEAYAGSGVGNLGSVTAVEGDHVGQPAYADIVVPPLATVWFRSAVRLSLADRGRTAIAPER